MLCLLHLVSKEDMESQPKIDRQNTDVLAYAGTGGNCLSSVSEMRTILKGSPDFRIDYVGEGSKATAQKPNNKIEIKDR